MAGVDGIPAEFYKHGCNELLPAPAITFWLIPLLPMENIHQVGPLV